MDKHDSSHLSKSNPSSPGLSYISKRKALSNSSSFQKSQLPEDQNPLENIDKSSIGSQKPSADESSKDKMDVDRRDEPQSFGGNNKEGSDDVSSVNNHAKPQQESVRSRLKSHKDVIGRPLPKKKAKQRQKTGGQNEDGRINDGSVSKKDTTKQPVTKKGKKNQKQASNAEDGDSELDDEHESEEETTGQHVTPPNRAHSSSSTTLRQDQQAVTELELEAAAVLKPNSYTISGFECSEASRVLAAVLGLSLEERDAFLALSHDELVKGFKKQVKKQLMKDREVDHPQSPAHKRTRHN